MATKRVTTDDAGVIILNGSFNESTLLNVTLTKENILYYRYILFPKSLIDISKLRNIRSMYFNVKYDLRRSAGTATTDIYGLYGTTSSNTEFGDTFIVQSSDKTDYILQNNILDGFEKYIDGTYDFIYNGNEYYCVKYRGSFGSVLSKFTGSVNLKQVAFGVEYDDSTKIYNGSNGITSAYLGSTKLNGIYLGDKKLL